MKEFGKKLWAAISSIWRIHIGINALVTFIFVGILVYKFLLKDVIVASDTILANWYDPASYWHAVILGIGASIIAAAIIGIVGVFLLNWYSKMKLTGEYDAFELNADGTETAWGKVTIKYAPMNSATHHTSVKLRLINDEIILEGAGIIIDNRYITGHYSETGKPERRRSGAFMYELSGAGNVWEGTYVRIAPDLASPQEGRAKWVKT